MLFRFPRICRKVTVFEFADTLKADQVLQEKARSLPNVEIFNSSQTIKVDGNGEKVTSIRIKEEVYKRQGKTAAFGLPLIQKINVNNRIPQSLILLKGRELLPLVPAWAARNRCV